MSNRKQKTTEPGSTQNISGSLQIDVKKIGTFLKSIDGAEYLFMQHCMSMRDSIQGLIKRHKLTKAEFCRRFKIETDKYQDYIMGNYDYSLKDVACLNAASMELDVIELEDKVEGQSEQFKCGKCSSNWGELRTICFNCGHESEDLST